MSEQQLTCGEFEYETESVSHLSNLLTDMKLGKDMMFNVFSEVKGLYEYVPHFKPSGKTPRIDFLLTPSIKFIQSGWKFGAIGIECKRSNEKVGPPISQILDYSRAVFRHPNFNVLLKMDFIFLWPCEKTHGTIASFMAQNRFGSVTEYSDSYRHKLLFCCGEDRVFDYDFKSSNVSINGKFKSGKRVGSR